MDRNKGTKTKKRCAWVNQNTLYIDYHDKEWGVPLHDDRKLFEMLILEGAQAGLSWETILNKRENYRKAFNKFDPQKISNYTVSRIGELLGNTGIIRNRLKIQSAIRNAKVFLTIQKEFGSFDNFIWGFVDYKPINHQFKKVTEIPAKTELSITLSKDLKNRGMNFVGSTIIYAYMQAIGMVNDHTTDCFRYSLTQT